MQAATHADAASTEHCTPIAAHCSHRGVLRVLPGDVSSEHRQGMAWRPQLQNHLGRTSAPSATSSPWLMRVTPIQ